MQIFENLPRFHDFSDNINFIYPNKRTQIFIGEFHPKTSAKLTLLGYSLIYHRFSMENMKQWPIELFDEAPIQVLFYRYLKENTKFKVSLLTI